MRISESKLRRIIRDVIIESEEVDPWVLLHRQNQRKKDSLPSTRSVSDSYDLYRDNLGTYNYAIKVIKKCKAADYAISYVENDLELLNEPIKIGKTPYDLIDIRAIVKRCHDNKDSISPEDCAAKCIEEYEESKKYYANF